MKPVNCFIPCSNPEDAMKNVQFLANSEIVNKIYLLTSTQQDIEIEGCINIPINALCSSETLQKIAEKSDSAYSVIYTKDTQLELGQYALERLYQIAEATQAGMVYSDYYQQADGKTAALPLIDYQEGSLRDDFNFGSLLFYNAELLK